MDTKDIERRLKKLEDKVFGDDNTTTSAIGKRLSLSELAGSLLISNGQQKIVVVLGHNELILKEGPISMPEIRKAWTAAKFDLKPDPKQLERAIKAGLVRDADDTKKYDLTRKGEAYFQTVVEDVNND